MEYKVIKSFPWAKEGTLIEATYHNLGYYNLRGDNMTSSTYLIDKEFLEPIEESPKPRWKVGDYVKRLYTESSYSTYLYIKVMDIHISKNGNFIYNGLTERYYSDPTKEELEKYFR